MDISNGKIDVVLNQGWYLVSIKLAAVLLLASVLHLDSIGCVLTY